MSISVEKVTKVYGTQKALDEVSFEINKGEIVGFLGPNGAGKSTLMKILTTYLQPTDGVAKVGGFATNEAPEPIQKMVGYLPEHNPLYLDLYVREYLEFCRGIHQAPKNRIEEVIQLTGLATESHKKIGALSKGYRQRVGLAAALLHDPEVLILDEPTTGLDPNQLVEIRQLIQTVGKNKTVFLSTHIMQEVDALCDRVLMMRAGRLVLDEKLSELRHARSLLLTTNQSGAELEPVLRCVTGVKTIETLGKNAHGEQLRIHLGDAADVQATTAALARLVLENNAELYQLQPETRDLESLFRDINNATLSAKETQEVDRAA